MATLFFTEMWERFSYNGVRALLVLYLVGSTQQPGLGFSATTAATVYGWYAMLAFSLGVPGGWIGDRWLGNQHAVIAGGAIIAIGHLIMAIPGTPFFFAGLLFVVAGTGLLKPNVSTLVGSLYSKDDPRRDAGFSIYYMGINSGGILAPLVCGWLGQRIDWRFGFAAAGVGMLFGLAQFLAGRKYLPDVRPHHVLAADVPQEHAKHGATRVMVIVILSAFAIVFWAAFEQAATSLTLFADRATRLEAFGQPFPSSWFQSVEPLFIVLGAPLFAWLWVRLGRFEPSSPTKFALGLGLHAVCFAIVLPAARMFDASGMRVSPWWVVAFYICQAAAELCLSPVGLSLVTRLSPPRIAGLMMGVWFLATAMGGYLAGWYAGFLDQLSFTQLFVRAGLIVSVAAGLLFALVPVVKRLMR